MATADFKYRILTDTNAFGDSTDALDAFTTRVVMSNLNHTADEFSQVRCAISGTTPSLISKAGYLVSRTPSAVSTPYSIASVSFPISVRASGKSYRMRIRLGGATANVAANAIFYAALSAGADAASSLLTASDASFTTALTASTTAAWLTGTSRGTNAWTTMIELSAAQMAACYVDFPTTVSLGGAPASVRVPWVTLTVFSSTSDILYTPRLYAVYAAEVIGL